MRYEIKTHSSPLSFAILGFIFLAGDPQKFSLATPGAAAQEQPAGQDRVNSSEGSAHSSKNLAELCRDEGKYDGADVLYQRSLAIAETTLAPKRPEIAAMRVSYSSFQQKSQAAEITFPTQEVE